MQKWYLFIIFINLFADFWMENLYVAEDVEIFAFDWDLCFCSQKEILCKLYLFIWKPQLNETFAD